MIAPLVTSAAGGQTPSAPSALSSPRSAMPLRLGTREQFARVRELLLGAGYLEAAVVERTGQPYDEEPVEGDEPREAPPPTDALGALTGLFLYGNPLPAATVRATVGPDSVEALAALGLIEVREPGELCTPAVLLYPTQGVYIASDLNHNPRNPRANVGPPPADVVYPAITTNTVQFMSTISRTPCDSFLELCAGTGVAALAAARWFAERSWAVDITERSTIFAQFNASLNALDNATALCGDLYEPVRGLTFDRIAAHPPYVAAAEQEYIFRDGGEDGEQITRRIVEGLPEFLRPGGRFYCTCMATDRANAPFEQRIREMLGERQEEFDVLVVQRYAIHPDEYYSRVASKGKMKFAEVDAWHQRFTRLKVERMVYCSFVVQRRAEPRPVFTVRRETGPDSGAPEYDWLLAWHGALAGDPDLPAWLVESRPVASPRGEMRPVYRMREGKWVIAACSLWTESPFRADAECALWGPTFLARCDGTRTVRQHLQELKAAGAVRPEAPEADFFAFVESLIGAGFIEVEPFRLPDPVEGLDDIVPRAG